MINFASNLNKMIDAGLGGPLDPPRTEVAVGHRVVYTEASGAMVNFETNVIAPVKNLRVTMEPIQAGSGDPSPDNIRPITGRESVTVTRTGANLLPPVLKNNAESLTNNGVTLTIVNGKFHLSGTGTSNGGRNALRSAGFTLPAGTYTRVGSAIVMKADTTVISDATFTLTEATEIYIGCNIVNGTVYDEDREIAIVKGDTAVVWSPYNGTSVTLQLGQTVYGGTVDVTGGSALKTMDIRDLSALTWRYYAADNYFYASMGNRFPNGTNGKGFCSAYKFFGTAISATLASMPDMNFGFTSNSGSKYIYIKDSRYTDAASFQTAVAGVQLVYDLQPSSYEEITTDPVSMTTLKGQNNVWSNSGDVTLEYPYYEETEGY